MEEWSIQDLDFSPDDFTMDCTYDLLAALIYKSGQYAYRLLPYYLVKLIASTASRCTSSTSLTASPTRAQKGLF